MVGEHRSLLGTEPDCYHPGADHNPDTSPDDGPRCAWAWLCDGPDCAWPRASCAACSLLRLALAHPLSRKLAAAFSAFPVLRSAQARHPTVPASVSLLHAVPGFLSAIASLLLLS